MLFGTEKIERDIFLNLRLDHSDGKYKMDLKIIYYKKIQFKKKARFFRTFFFESEF